MVVGITGGIGSGKSTVTDYFKELTNIVIYVADDEAKKLMTHSKKLKEAIKNEFGEESYNGNQLNRAYLSNLVFQNKEKLNVLNAIVHPVVKQHFHEFINAHKNKIIIYENAILFETGSSEFCDFIITVFADFEERIQRVMQRDGTTKKEVLNRAENQWKDEKKMLLSNYIITNDYTESLKDKVRDIYNILTKKSVAF